MSRRITLTFRVNGEIHERQAEPRLLLSDFLRHELGLAGTHVGCEHGVCGACTVLLDGEAVRSCLLFAVQAHGREVRTVEGLTADGEAKLHPLQEAFRETHALQCGFCTPGFLMSLIPFLRENPDPERAQIREALAGNLCRCTGYQNIVDAVELAARRMKQPGHAAGRVAGTTDAAAASDAAPDGADRAGRAAGAAARPEGGAADPTRGGLAGETS